MIIKNTFTKEIDLLSKRYENFKKNNDFINKTLLKASTFRVAAFMAAVGFTVLTAISVLTLNVPCMNGFALCALFAHDLYHIAKNYDEKELCMNPKFFTHTGSLMMIFIQNDLIKGKDHETTVRLLNLKKAENLTENTLFARPAVALVGLMIK
jgi:hypothetical protein